MIGIGIIVVNLWFLAVLILFLHWQTQRWGFAPFLVVLGGLTGIIEGHYGIYIEPATNLLVFITSNVLVPIVVMTILVLYITNGSVSARMGIYSILFVSLTVLGMQIMLQVYRSLPEGEARSG